MPNACTTCDTQTTSRPAPWGRLTRLVTAGVIASITSAVLLSFTVPAWTLAGPTLISLLVVADATRILLRAAGDDNWCPTCQNTLTTDSQ